jgi:hypothetical protein
MNSYCFDFCTCEVEKLHAINILQMEKENLKALFKNMKQLQPTDL